MNELTNLVDDLAEIVTKRAEEQSVLLERLESEVILFVGQFGTLIKRIESRVEWIEEQKPTLSAIIEEPPPIEARDARTRMIHYEGQQAAFRWIANEIQELVETVLATARTKR